VSVNWAPNDSLFKVQWHHRLIGSEEAWNSSRGSKAVKVSEEPVLAAGHS
jgi:hypothetical protein